MTHHPLQLGQWLTALQPSRSWASNKALKSTAFSGDDFGNFFCNTSALLTKTLFEHKSGKLQTFWHFLSGWLHSCPLPHWHPAPSSSWWASLWTIHMQAVFLWLLGYPRSEEPGKSSIWPLPTAWRVWQWNFCHANIWEGRANQRFIHGLQVDPLCGC